MKIIDPRENDGSTQEDVDKAIETLDSFYRMLANPSGKKKPSPSKIKDDGKYLRFD